MNTIVTGKNTVREAVSSGCATKVITLERFQRDPIVVMAQAKKISVELAKDDELTRIAKNPSHQGFVAICKEWRNYSIGELIEDSKNSKYPLLLILDGIEDPHN